VFTEFPVFLGAHSQYGFNPTCVKKLLTYNFRKYSSSPDLALEICFLLLSSWKN
jgi:hypothetical protein